jgi:hypothetical protein
MPFIARVEKASWGIPCNQNAEGRLFVGKGFVKTLESQFGAQLAADVSQALSRVRGDRCGHFWLDFETRSIRVQIGESHDNHTRRTQF